jgi:2-phosphosulfolactate phosphatase
MQIEIVANIGEARFDDLLHKTVIVIDVLRATSTIITALAHGCSGVVPVETVLQARELQADGDLLGGERFCKKIAGFDFGNSPLEYQTAAIQDKRILLTTTNGTRGIQKATKADHILAGALINGRACARVAFELRRDVVILCAGTQDVFSLEDGLCAGQLVDEITALIGVKEAAVNDMGLALRASYLHVMPHREAALLGCSNGKRLSKLGFQQDIAYCASMNQFSLVPVLRNGMLVPYRLGTMS